MIRIFLGNVGSGKTACAVREMILQPSKNMTFSNIQTKYIKNNTVIDKSMLIKEEIIGMKKSGEPIKKLIFNKDYWLKAVNENGMINVTLDEVHTLLSARRGMTKSSQVMLDFLALIRRIIGQTTSGSGTLTLITQLERRIDVIAKEMCNHVRYHVCWYKKTCTYCKATWRENNEEAELLYECPRCKSSHIIKHSHIIEVWHFQSMDLFIKWKYYGLPAKKTAYRHYMINDIEKYFGYYNTLQWDNLITDF